MKPNYICIGVQKGGTTSLKSYLNFHPQIYMYQKEMHFFDRNLTLGDLTYEDIETYERSFDTSKQIVGEKTPSYNYLRFAIDRIYNYNKNMKLIILLREPISRAYSQYNMCLQKNGSNLNEINDHEILNEFKKQGNQKLCEIQSNCRDKYNVVRGYYDEILEYIFSKFSRDNIYIGISEEINQDKMKYYNEIYEFLGASKLDINENLNVNEREYAKTIPKSLESYLYDIYKPHNEKLYEMLGRKIDIWEQYYATL